MAELRFPDCIRTMKQLIVLVASVMLGLAIFGMIAGKENSIYSTLENAWEKEADHRVLSSAPAR